MSDPRWLDDSEKAEHRVLRQALDEAPRWARSEVRQRRLWTRLADAAHSVRVTRRAFRIGALVASVLTVFLVSAIELARWQMSGDDAPTTTATATATPAAPVAPVTPPGVAVVAAAPAPLGEVIETCPRERRIRELPQDARAELLPSSVLALDDTARAAVHKGP